MTLDIQMMVRIANEHYATAVGEAFGEEGTDALRTMLQTIREIYAHVEPELISETLVVFHAVDIGVAIAPKVSPVKPYPSVDRLASAYDAEARAATSLVEIHPTGYLSLHKAVLELDVIDLSRTGVVYMYSRGEEWFIINGTHKAVWNPSRGVHLSVFSIPTFRKLEDALEDYRIRFVRRSQCPVFNKVWENEARLAFRNKPEATMRRSLAYYLNVALRGDAEAHQEKIVDESHPVDVEVTWSFAKRKAIIEIKWIGDSRTPTGNFTTYRDSRARDGARQLADYLDDKAAQSPTDDLKGYLVVFDGRRENLGPQTTSLTMAEAMAYADREITYDPAYHEQRNDFAVPIRMFAEPALAACIVD